MKALHVIPAVAPRYGGPSEAIVHMGRALAAAGVSVTVVTTDADGPARLGVPCGTAVDWRGVSTIFFRRRGGEAAKVSLPLAAWLLAHAREFDVVHLHGIFSFSTTVAASVARLRGVPYVVRPLGTLAPWSLGQKSLKKRIALAGGLRRLLRNAAAIHYTSEGERRAAEGAAGIERGVVIPLGVDPELLAPPPPTTPGPPYVVTVGRLHPKKNLPALIEAFARAQPRAPEGARLVIAGDGESAYVESLRGLVRRDGLLEHVRFAGWVSGDEKRRLIAGARVFAMPSAQENFGIAAVEALALGVPVVLGEEVDLAPSVSSEACGWVTRVNATDLAATLLDALDHPEEAARRGRRGAELVRREFRWEVAAERLVALYRRIVAR